MKVFREKLRSNLGVRLTLSIGLVIAVTSVLLFFGIYRLEKQQAMQHIHTEAQALLTEMIVLREWVAHYKGVWTTEPGEYFLDDEGGFYRKSPAMVTKELSDLSDEKGYYRFHITSLNLTNPENMPDNFEHDALSQFEYAPVPVSSFESFGDEPVYRLMIPLMVQESCLECHKDQGYEIGDVRGGLSVLIPTSEMEASLANSRRVLVFSALSIVGLVMVTLYFMIRRMVIAPVRQLKTVADSVGEGNYDIQSTLSTGDELEVFGQTLNQMTANLKVSRDSLTRRIFERTQELDAISDVALIISRAGDLVDVLEEALTTVVEVANAAGGLIQLFEGDRIRVAAHTALPSGVLNCMNFLFQEKEHGSELRQVREAVRTAEINGLICEAIFPGSQCKTGNGACASISEDYSQLVSILLSSRRRSLGVLTLFSVDSNAFSTESMPLLECIGHQLGVAVENAKFHQRTEQVAILEERTRISREMHDSLAQTLGWLRIKTEMLENDLNLEHFEKSQTDIMEIRRVVRDACYDVRESIDGLRTRPTGDLFSTAAAWVSEFRQRSGLLTDFRAMDESVHLSAVVEAELLRILQEALTNVRKHAQAEKVRVELQVKGNFAELVVEDDGIGFEYLKSQDKKHFGLRIMRERAERLGGVFRVDTALGRGTKIIALLPFHPSMRSEVQ